MQIMVHQGSTGRGVDVVRRRQAVVVGHITIVIVILAFWTLYTVLEPPADALIRPLSWLFLLLTAWLYLSWRLVGRSLLDPYAIVLVAAALFNGGQLYLEAFGLNPAGVLDGGFAAETIVDVQFLVSAALAALHAGALVAVASAGNSRQSGTHAGHGPIDLWSCRLVGIGLIVVSIVPYISIAKARFDTVYTSGYYALYQQNSATGFDAVGGNLATFLIPGALFLLAGSRERRGLRTLSSAVVTMGALLDLFAGQRGHAAMPVIAYAWLWHRLIRPLPTAAVLGVAVVALFVVFPLLREVRNISGADRTDPEFLGQTYLSIDNPAVAILSEVGGTMATVAHTRELVPSVRPYDYGVGYLYALTSALPNLFWDRHPAATASPTDWLIWTIDPFTARMGGSFGYSFIAEAYLNFGPIGVPVFMAVIGLLYCRLVLWGDLPSAPAKAASLASFIAFGLFYVRGEALFIVRPLLWSTLLPYWTSRCLAAFLTSHGATEPRQVVVAARATPTGHRLRR